MDRLIYTVLTGLQRAQEAQAVTAHNLANVQTPGFRREMAMTQPAYLADGVAARPGRTQATASAPHDLTGAGPVRATDNPLDIALPPDTWLSVLDAKAEPALTRRGDLRLDSEGLLRTGAGHAVRSADDGEPIRVAVGAGALRIGTDGTLTARVAPDAPEVAVARLFLAVPGPDLERTADGLFRAEDIEAAAGARLTAGALEGANMDPSTGLVELVEQSRRFEMQTRLLAAARELDERTASLMRVE
jgi:flagellar basal-body rod protein FlgF